MNNNENVATATLSNAEQGIADYLAAHPEFFTRHPALAASLHVPHGVDGAVSLVEHQLATLRAHNRALHARLAELIENARVNEALSERLHTLSLRIQTCRSAAAIISTLQGTLREEFQAEMVSIELGDAAAADDDMLVALWTQAEQANGALCGQLPAAQRNFLFKELAVNVMSAVALSFSCDGRPAILAIGSEQATRFRADMDTFFLRRLCQLVAVALEQRQA